MKRLLFILLTLITVSASAQRIQKNTTYGISFNRTGADTLLFIPTDTFAVPSVYQSYGFISRKGTTLYLWNTSTFRWGALAGGGSTDTTSLSDRINRKWSKDGDALTDPVNDFLGTTDPTDFVFRTNNLEVARFGGTDYNFKFGLDNIATGAYSMAIGRQDTASGGASFAAGFKSKASGDQSVALGNGSKATASAAVSVGGGNTASGIASFASGLGNIASGSSSTATGGSDTASGNYSFVAGFENKASGVYSFAQGHESKASGVVSIAMGNGAVSTGYGATTFGKGFTNAKDTSFAVGFTTRKFEVSPDSVIISPVNVSLINTKKIESRFTDTFYVYDATADRVLIDGVKSTIWGPGAQSRINIYGDTLEFSPTASTGKLMFTNVYASANADDSMLVRDASSGFVGYRAIPTGGGSISLAAIGSTPNANGATLSGSTLNLEPASASFGGVVTTGTQTFAGAKTFSSNAVINGMTAGTYGGDQGFQVSNSKSLYFVTNGTLLNFEAGSAKLQVQIAGAGAYTQGALVYGGNTGYWRMGSNMQLVGSAGYTSLGAAGTVDLLKVSTTAITADLPVVLKSYTVATLPTGVVGMTAYVTDASGPTYLATVSGGGAVVTPVFYNGTNWVCH